MNLFFIIASIVWFAASIPDAITSSHPLMREQWFLYKAKDGKFSLIKYLLFNVAGFVGFLLFGVFAEQWTAAAIVMLALSALRVFFAIRNRKRLNKALGK